MTEDPPLAEQAVHTALLEAVERLYRLDGCTCNFRELNVDVEPSGLVITVRHDKGCPLA